MNLHSELYDTELNPATERKLRDGLFNLETIRFGKIPEIMIKKLYDYRYPNGTTEYDLLFSNEDGTEEHIEVKFSCVREKEKTEIDEDNALSVCIDNSQASVNRKVKAAERTAKIFDCNIQQVKPDHFSKLYYGLFFEEQIAIFMMPSSDMLDFFTMKRFKKYASTLAKIRKNLDEVQPRLGSQNGRDITYIKNRIEGGKQDSIPDLLDKAKGELEEISENRDTHFANARNIIQDCELLVELNNVKTMLIDEHIQISDKYDAVLNLYENGVAAIERDMIPNLSTKQHRGNEGEGQFHITNSNIEWHLESGYFLGWLSYKDLYSLLNNENN